MKRIIHTLNHLKTWQLILIFLLSLFLSLTCLRVNHLRMSRLRSAVIEADSNNDSALLAENLNKLRDFAFSHVVVSLVEENGNSRLKLGTGPFYLEASYRRAAASALEEVANLEVDDSNPNGNIYAIVSEICRPRAIANGWSWDSPEHIACYTEELAKFPAEDVLGDTATATLPSTELFRREYASPIFTFTFTTFSLLLSATLGLLLLLRFVLRLFLEIILSASLKAKNKTFSY